MGRIDVYGADVKDGVLEALRVRIHGLPPRTIDRDTTIAWMRDGHSFIPIVGGEAGPALQLVQIEQGDDVQRFVRVDNATVTEDALPALPACADARA